MDNTSTTVADATGDVTRESGEKLSGAHEPVAYGVEYREGGQWILMSGIVCFDRANAERIAGLGGITLQPRRVTPLYRGWSQSQEVRP